MSSRRGLMDPHVEDRSLGSIPEETARARAQAAGAAIGTWEESRAIGWRTSASASPARPTRSSSRTDLPTPGSPLTTTHPAQPVPIAVQELDHPCALGLSAYQHALDVLSLGLRPAGVVVCFPVGDRSTHAERAQR
jgi:hypothetical protein